MNVTSTRVALLALILGTLPLACGDGSGDTASDSPSGGTGGSTGTGGAGDACSPACSAGQLCSATGVCIAVGTCLAPADCPIGMVCNTASQVCETSGAGGAGGSGGANGTGGSGGSPTGGSGGSPTGGTGGGTGTTLTDLVVYQSTEDGSGNEIYVMNIDTSAKTRLTHNDVEDIQPDWAPDGSWIAFASNRDGNLEIYRMGRDGTGVTRLTNATGEDSLPAVSPDGSRIAFVSNRDGNRELYVMSADGTGITRLTHQDAEDTDPAFSSDGSRIFFVSMRDDASGDVYSMSATNGSALTRLTQNTGQDVYPAVNDTNTLVVFASARDTTGKVLELFVMQADTGSAVSKVSTANAETNHQYPVWTHDGTRIIYAAGDMSSPPPSGDQACDSQLGSFFCKHTFTSCCLGWSSAGCESELKDGTCSEQPMTRHIFVMNATGGAVSQLTTQSDGFADHPSIAWGAAIGSGGGTSGTGGAGGTASPP